MKKIFMLQIVYYVCVLPTCPPMKTLYCNCLLWCLCMDFQQKKVHIVRIFYYTTIVNCVITKGKKHTVLIINL